MLTAAAAAPKSEETVAGSTASAGGSKETDVDRQTPGTGAGGGFKMMQKAKDAAKSAKRTTRRLSVDGTYVQMRWHMLHSAHTALLDRHG